MNRVNESVSGFTCISTMAACTATYSLQYTLALGFKGINWSFHDFLAQPVMLFNH